MNPLTDLINQLKKFPGIGQKSAERLAFFVISLSEKDVENMSSIMTQTKKNICYCKQCYNISFTEICSICTDPSRDKEKLLHCRRPKRYLRNRTIRRVQRTISCSGRILISPLDNIEPDSLRINELVQRIQKDPFNEVILAINPSVEGDTTSLYHVHIKAI